MPDVGGIMGYYSFQPVHLLRGSRGAGPHGVDKIGEGKRHLTQIGYFGRPVIHLDVYIYMIIGAPWRVESVGPYSLKVCRQAARAGTAYKQVSAELVVKFNKVGVVIAVLHCSYPGICCEVIAVGRSEVDR